MRARRLLVRIGVALAAATAAAPALAEASAALQPYQLVRSLQLVQDRIADGDHAALPMQRKLLEMIDQRFREADISAFEDRQNFRAILIYGMSGGNPGTIERIVAKLKLENADRRYADGVLSYLRGKPQVAALALADTDPLKEAADIGAFTALIKGSIIAAEKPAEAMTLLGQARLLNPGTLVEEAALRRSITVATALGDADRFLFLCEDYARRFLRSPYASQYADALVSGVLAMHGKIDTARLHVVTSAMDREQQKVVYLRIARRAALENLVELTAFATKMADGIGVVEDVTADPRAELYSSLTTVTSDTVFEVLEKLRKLDRSKLSEGDRALLEAAEAAAVEMTTPVPVPAAGTAPGAGDVPAASEPEEQPLPVEAASVEPAADGTTDPETPGGQPAEEAAAARQGGSADQGEAAATPAPDPGDETAAIVSDVRRRLEAVDTLLKGSEK